MKFSKTFRRQRRRQILLVSASRDSKKALPPEAPPASASTSTSHLCMADWCRNRELIYQGKFWLLAEIYQESFDCERRIHCLNIRFWPQILDYQYLSQISKTENFAATGKKCIICSSAPRPPWYKHVVKSWMWIGLKVLPWLLSNGDIFRQETYLYVIPCL